LFGGWVTEEGEDGFPKTLVPICPSTQAQP